MVPEVRISLVEGVVSAAYNVIDLLPLALLCQQVKLVSHRVGGQGITRPRYKHNWHLYISDPLIIWPFDASYSPKQSSKATERHNASKNGRHRSKWAFKNGYIIQVRLQS